MRLEHVRVGGKIYTTARWLKDFGKAVAEADRAYFDLQEPVSGGGSVGGEQRPRHLAHRRPSASRIERQLQESHERAERELEEAGL